MGGATKIIFRLLDSIPLAVLRLLPLQQTVGVPFIRPSVVGGILHTLLECKHAGTDCYKCNASADHVKSAVRYLRHDCP